MINVGLSVQQNKKHYMSNVSCLLQKALSQSIVTFDVGRVSGPGESKIKFANGDSKLQDKLVHILDTLQPAKFPWQWVSLRLILNEQALIEKLEAHDASLSDVVQLSSPSPEKATASENENNFIVILPTKLLGRPDAALLFSELVHLFGRSLQDLMLLQAKRSLAGQAVLFGWKTIRQRLHNVAESKGLSAKMQYSEPWGWCSPCTDPVTIKGEKKKFDATSLEEGEIVDEGTNLKRSLKGLSQVFDSDSSRTNQQHLGNIELQIAAVTGGSKPVGSTSPGVEGQTNKVNTRKSIRGGGNSGLARRLTVAIDSSPPSLAALRVSMSLQSHLYGTRHFLAPVILRLLGSRVVHEDAYIVANSMHSKKDL
ncbi:hypothetical protein TSUD_349540 [Trifolium subterraneum]|uniref:Uncharacterized protein n=1 Tax=Trifolium subterraneum TaxID=3900 RepID=A0A2Z6P6A8_TRISU|nr:hypothetical protein TSUD_349540 [Trifolium subterraneum]